MEAMIKLGDIIINVTNCQLPDMPTKHTIVATDTFTGTSQCNMVNDEPMAIKVIQDFLNPEGPEGLFKELFTHKDFNP